MIAKVLIEVSGQCSEGEIDVLHKISHSNITGTDILDCQHIHD